ncbi:hypothetical protein SLE2022_216630 [Rubroshorea leprosula]
MCRLCETFSDMRIYSYWGYVLFPIRLQVCVCSVVQRNSVFITVADFCGFLCRKMAAYSRLFNARPMAGAAATIEARRLDFKVWAAY